MAAAYVSKYDKQIQNTLNEINALRTATYDPLVDPVYKTYGDQMDREGEAARKRALVELSDSSGHINSWTQASAQQLAEAYNKKKQDIIPTLVAQNNTKVSNQIADLLSLSNSLLQQDQVDYSRHADQRDYEYKLQTAAQEKAAAAKAQQEAAIKAQAEAVLKAQNEKNAKIQSQVDKEAARLMEIDTQLPYMEAVKQAQNNVNGYYGGGVQTKSVPKLGLNSGFTAVAPENSFAKTSLTSNEYRFLEGNNGIIMKHIREGKQKDAYYAVKAAHDQGKISDAEADNLIEVYGLYRE